MDASNKELTHTITDARMKLDSSRIERRNMAGRSRTNTGTFI